MNRPFIKYSLITLYTYGFTRALYYNDKLITYRSTYDKRSIMIGDKCENAFYSVFLTILLLPFYIFDDLNTSSTLSMILANPQGDMHMIS